MVLRPISAATAPPQTWNTQERNAKASASTAASMNGHNILAAEMAAKKTMKDAAMNSATSASSPPRLAAAIAMKRLQCAAITNSTAARIATQNPQGTTRNRN